MTHDCSPWANHRASFGSSSDSEAGQPVPIDAKKKVWKADMFAREMDTG